MAGNTTTPQKEDPKKRGLLAQLFGLLLTIVVFLWTSTLIAIALECGGALLGIWDMPISVHAQRQIELELGYLGQFSAANQPVNRMASVLTGWIYVWSGIGPFFGFVVAAIKQLQLRPDLLAFVDATLYATQLVTIRCVIAVLTLPLFFLVGAVATVDGLVMRELRKFRAGHESSLLHHMAHRNIKPWIVYPWLIYITDPFSVHPNWIFIPSLCLFGTAIAVSMAKFKKVL